MPFVLLGQNLKLVNVQYTHYSTGLEDFREPKTDKFVSYLYTLFTLRFLIPPDLLLVVTIPPSCFLVILVMPIKARVSYSYIQTWKINR